MDLPGDARPDGLLCWWDAVLDEDLPPISTCPWPRRQWGGDGTTGAAPTVHGDGGEQPLQSLAGGGAELSASGDAIGGAHASHGMMLGQPPQSPGRGPARHGQETAFFTTGLDTDSSHLPPSHPPAKPYEREHWLNPCFLTPPWQVALCESSWREAAARALKGLDAERSASAAPIAGACVDMPAENVAPRESGVVSHEGMTAEIIAWHDECELVLQLNLRGAGGGERGEDANGGRESGGSGSRGGGVGQVLQKGSSDGEAAGGAVHQGGREDTGGEAQASNDDGGPSLPPCTCGVHSPWGAERIVEINRMDWRGAVAAVRRAVRCMGGMALGSGDGVEGQIGSGGRGGGCRRVGVDGSSIPASAMPRERRSSVPFPDRVARAPPPRTLDLSGDPLWSILLARDGCAVSCVTPPGVAAAVAQRFVRANGAARREGQWAEPGVAVVATGLMEEDEAGSDEDSYDVSLESDGVAQSLEGSALDEEAGALDGAAPLHRARNAAASTELECFLTPLISAPGCEPNKSGDDSQAGLNGYCPRRRTQAVVSLLLFPPSFPHLRHQWSGSHLAEMIRRALAQQLGLIRPSTPQLPCAFRLRAVLLSCERLSQRHAPAATCCGINVSRFNSLGAPSCFRSLQLWQWDHTLVGDPFTLAVHALPLARASEEGEGIASHVPSFLDAEARDLPPVAAASLCHAVAVWVDFNFVASGSEGLRADASTGPAAGESTLGDGCERDNGWIVATGPVPQLAGTTRAESKQGLRGPTPWAQGIYFLEAPVPMACGARPTLSLRMALSGEGAGALQTARVGVTSGPEAVASDLAGGHGAAAGRSSEATGARQVLVDRSLPQSARSTKRRRDEEAESS
jgi:hypothetical protein